jgi:hypothetical protein
MKARAPLLRPRVSATLLVFQCLLIVTASAWTGSVHAGETGAWQDTIDNIQRTCLRTYPPEMLRAMTTKGEGEEQVPGTDEIPESVDASPEEQQQFLTSTIELDKGLFYPILLEDLFEAFKEYVKPGVRFLDLGSGDGRVVFLANAMGAEATGIEYDHGMVDVSKKAMKALGDTVDPGRVRFIEGDFFEQPWSGYDVIFYFDLTSFEHHALRQKIAEELDPGARLLVGHQQGAFPGLALETLFPSVHVYRQPQSSMRDGSLPGRCKKEVKEIHRFLEHWYNGAIERSEESFARLSDAVARGFNYVGTNGRVMRRDVLLDQVRRAWGSWRQPGSTDPGSGRFRIENLRIRLIEGPLTLVSYEEWHEVDGRSQGKMTSALFRLEHGRPNRVAWSHLHQSEIPSGPRPGR